jgi:hypothetical protein
MWRRAVPDLYMGMEENCTFSLHGCGGELYLISTWVWRRALPDLYMGMEESWT